jgi:branched-chain amino acid transport system ATP-binding protein
MGKTTTLRALFGLLPLKGGEIRFGGARVDGRATDAIARLGLALVPEGRHVFPNLTVRENLQAFAENRSGAAAPWTVARVMELFPRLAERRDAMGSQLSGGEQQMLAIARILRTGARFLMLDEPTEGLAPVIIQQIGKMIARLKQEGFTILLVEQNFRFASTVADRFYIVEHGKIIDTFANSELQANMDKLHTYLGV